MKPKEPKHLDSLIAEPDAGWFSRLFVEEEAFDKRKLWQLGTWGSAALGALVLAFMAAQTSHTLRRDLANVTDIARQNRELATIVTERDSETRRLASALDTLNADRDRLYARVAGLEQNLDSVTGSIKRQSALPAPNLPSAPPVVAAPESIAAAPAPEIKSVEPPQADAAPAPAVTAAIPSQPQSSALPEIPAARTEFGVDLGTASSIEGLRALWRGIQAKHKDVLSPLRPIVMVKERSGLGMQLRLVAGPVSDAAAAARICAVLSEQDRTCEMSSFDGQRLAMAVPDAEIAPAPRPAAATPPQRRRSSQRVRRPAPAQAAPAPRPAQSSGVSSFFSRNN